MRKKIVAGNWKMNLNKSEADILYNNLESKNYPDDVEVIIAPASIYLDSFSNASKVSISSQDVSANNNGAFTGEFSAEMLSSINLRFAIVGHSERRTFHKETDLLIFQKVEMLLKHGITPIFCCGESLLDRESKNHFNVVKSQLSQILSNLSSEEFSKIVIILYKLVPNKSIKISPSFSPSQVSEFIVVDMFKSQDWQKKEATN